MEEPSESLIDDDDRQNKVPAYKGRKWMTVEPTILLYFMASMPLLPLLDQFVLQQVKHRWNVSYERNYSECLAPVNKSDPNYLEELSIEAEASRWMIILYAMTLFPSIFSTSMLGPYSDKAGRKKALITPLIGGLLRVVLSIFVVLFNLPLELLILASFIEGCSGGFSSMLMGTFASISDITTREQRALRIFILEVALGIGTFIAQVSIGYVIKWLGFMYPFVIVGGLHLINLFYTICLLPESKPGQGNVSFFTMDHLKKTWNLYTKDDGSPRRWKLLLLLLVLLIFSMVDLGGMDSLTFYIISAPLCFNSVYIGYFQAVFYIVRNICGLIAVKFFISRLGEIGLMLLGIASGIIFLIIVILSKTEIMILIAPIGAIFYMLLTPMVRSLASKQVSTDEQGAAFAGLGMAQCLAIMLGQALFNSIYSSTLDIFKPTVFIVEIGVLLICGLFIMRLWFMFRRERRHGNALIYDTD